MTPVLQDRKARCTACDKPITIKFLVGVEVSVFVAFMKKIRCPLCGANYRRISL